MAPQIGKWVVFITRAWDYSIFISKLFHLKLWTSRPLKNRNMLEFEIKTQILIYRLQRNLSVLSSNRSALFCETGTPHTINFLQIFFLLPISLKEALSEREIKFGRSLREWVPRLLSPPPNGDFQRIPGKSGTRQMTILVCVFSVTGTNGLNTLMREKFSSSCSRKQDQAESLLGSCLQIFPIRSKAKRAPLLERQRAASDLK